MEDDAVKNSPKLLDQVRGRLRVMHYSIRTEEAYLLWIRRFILFHGKRHPRDMGAMQVEAFLSHLAVVGNVAAATQNQALAAILFLYREVLGADLPWMADITRAKKPQRLPVVFGYVGGVARVGQYIRANRFDLALVVWFRNASA